MDHLIIRDFLRQAASALDTDLTGLARQAGVAPSTVTRVFKDDEGSLPSWRTLAKVAQVSGVPVPSALASPGDEDERLDTMARQMERIDSLLKNLMEATASISEMAAKVARTQQMFKDKLPVLELRQWLDSLPRVPSAQRNHLLEVVRGIAERSAASQNDPEPSEGSRVVHPGKRMAESTEA